MTSFPTYTIQDWLFNYAHGKIKIDLAESGIEPLHFSDVYDGADINLNYVRDRGTDELSNEIAEHYQVDSSQVAITNGGQEALYLFYTSMLEEDSELITFTPGWQQSWVVPRHIGCKVHQLQRVPDNNWQLPLEQIKDKVTEKTKIIVVNSPQNPTGQSLSEKEVHFLRELVGQNDIYLILDEEYKTNYGDSLIHDLPQSFSISSLSKVHGVPGLRVGWIVGDDEKVIEGVVNAKRYTTVSNSAVSEHIATSVLKNHERYVNRYQKMVKKGKEILQDWIEGKKNLELTPSDGTPYAYVSFDDDTDSKDFCERLIDENGVLLMPAEVFGDTNGFRITFARSENTLKEGLSSIDEMV